MSYQTPELFRKLLTFLSVSFAAYPDVEGPVKRDANADPMVVGLNKNLIFRKSLILPLVSFAAYPEADGPVKRDASKISYRSAEPMVSKLLEHQATVLAPLRWLRYRSQALKCD